MTVDSGATLRILERADKEILKLSRADKGAVYEFQHKFRRNPNHPGLHLKQLKGDTRLWSARVTQDYRALLLSIQDQDFLLVSVRHRKNAYDDLERYTYRINGVTGGIEVIDLAAIGDSILGRVAGDGAEPEQAADAAPPLFAHVTDEQFEELGVAPALFPAIAKVTTEEELLELADCVPQLTADVLLALYDGKTFDEVMEQITAPVAVGNPVDTEDYAAAVVRPATQVTTDDAALQAVLAESFARWQVYLHPTQRTLVEKNYNGPARVSGGPGTGKTIVALHRVKHLAEQLPEGRDKPILLTTFNRNLAADLRTRLLALGGEQLARRVDIVNIDKLASRVVAEGNDDTKRRIVGNDRALEEWRSLLLELDDQRFPPEFLAAEWAQVILGQALTSRTEYFRARRTGRGRSLKRDERDHIWQLVERFTQRLDEQGMWTMRQVAAAAARRELDRAARVEHAAANGENSLSTPEYRYRHIVVDEAQDLSAAHWTMLRAMVAKGPNDIFITGDPHQRLYDNYVTLSSLGINIRGRSAKLTLSYRTTRQILRWSMGMLTGETYDDLDGGEDDLTGYRSLLNGRDPVAHGLSTWAEERRWVAQQIKQWQDDDAGSIAIAVPTRQMADEMIRDLTDAGIDAVQVGPDGPARGDGFHVGTMHRFKGLEYQRMILSGVADGILPRQAIRHFQDSDPKRYQQERARERSLLFVAATRARDELVVTWHGKASEFLNQEGD
ncbi:UvrD-helicase domain-containing protein [Saccharomonospora azurea]|uniref:DNA 3'-5' helicase n=1 Tax=Saccharomonospora azurea NA-128 TaxID=882081 RepID=H8GFT2_9PSEU|nr:UvrD-helicase domain-containing protein [Saccharomonospora azurea]EHY91117.1 DNA/RNA helicase, superfamily I [Saccharomonospora azurea NA-128]